MRSTFLRGALSATDRPVGLFTGEGSLAKRLAEESPFQPMCPAITSLPQPSREPDLQTREHASRRSRACCKQMTIHFNLYLRDSKCKYIRN